MKRKRVMLAFGTRPEAIKMAPIYHALRAREDTFDLICCVTAQHRQMLDQVLKTFEIEPDLDLNVMRDGQDLTDVTTAVLHEMRAVLQQCRPDIVLVHGDTTTTMATALACFYANIPVAHVEAGLRTFDIRAPFPEEFNRRLTGMITQWHFAPTDTSKDNLRREGVADNRIIVTGNTVIDALLFVLDRIDQSAERKAAVERQLDDVMRFDWRASRFVLITGHRRENFGDGFQQICEALSQLADRFNDVHFVYPVHLNPNVRQPVNTYLRGSPNIHLIEPMTYEPFVYALKHSHIVLTDSGGIQEEAPSLGKPVIVMRNVTERPEAVEAGTVRLVGADREKIIVNVSELLTDRSCYERMSRAHNPYGDGQASRRIVESLERTE